MRGRTNQVINITRANSAARAFVRQMPRRVAIKLFNTGVGLKEGEPDPHWQLVARSDDPNFQPRPAVVTRVDKQVLSGERSEPVAMDFGRRRHVSPAGPRDVTFRTTFELAGDVAEDGGPWGRFLADNQVTAIRLNGRKSACPTTIASRRLRSSSPFRSGRDSWRGPTRWSCDVCDGELGAERRPPLWPA